MITTSYLKGLITVIKRTSSSCSLKPSVEDLIRIHDSTIANNYSPLPVVLSRGKGVRLYDVKGREYLDFLSGNAAVSLGHCHPKICKALNDQLWYLPHVSRTFYTRALAEYGEYMTELFCFEKILPLNSGNEAAEAAVKLARKWGYKKKGISANQAKVIFAESNHWGASIAAASASTDPLIYENYGPLVPCFETVPFSNSEALEGKLNDPNVCAFMVEPIQGEAGVVIPEPRYLKEARDLCTEHNVLMIADEMQCGLGRCGSMLCCDIYKVRPDILVLGKALSAGFLPVSAVLADADIMDVIEPGTHESTYGGNPLGCKVVMATLKILQEEKVIENSKQMGEMLRGCLGDLPKDVVVEVRGIGLLNALVLNRGVNANNLCLDLMKNGLLTKSTKESIIRLSPPLVIKEKDIVKAVQIIRRCVENSRGNWENEECQELPNNRNSFCRVPHTVKEKEREMDEEECGKEKKNCKACSTISSLAKKMFGSVNGLLKR